MIVPMPAQGATLDGLDFSLKPPKWARNAVKAVGNVVAKIAPIAAIAAPVLAPVLAPVIAAGGAAIKATGIGARVLSVAQKAQQVAANPLVSAATQTIKRIAQPMPGATPVATVAEAAANIRRPGFSRIATGMPVKPGARRTPAAFDAVQRGAAARKPAGPRGAKPMHRAAIVRRVNPRGSIASQFQRAAAQPGARVPPTVQEQAASMVNPVSLAPTGEATPPVSVEAQAQARVTPQLNVSTPASSQSYSDDFTPAPGISPGASAAQAESGLPGWVLPAALVAGVGLLAMRGRKRGAR